MYRHRRACHLSQSASLSPACDLLFFVIHEEPAPPESLCLRPACQLDAHGADRLTIIRARPFVRFSGSVRRAACTERDIHPALPAAPSGSITDEKGEETPSVHANEADPLGPGRLGSSSPGVSAGGPVSSPAPVLQPPPQDGRS